MTMNKALKSHDTCNSNTCISHIPSTTFQTQGPRKTPLD